MHTVLSGANVVAVVVVVAGVVDMRCKQVSSAIQIVYDNKYKTDSLWLQIQYRYFMITNTKQIVYDYKYKTDTLW